jgi:hypothetical protein
MVTSVIRCGPGAASCGCKTRRPSPRKRRQGWGGPRKSSRFLVDFPPKTIRITNFRSRLAFLPFRAAAGFESVESYKAGSESNFWERVDEDRRRGVIMAKRRGNPNWGKPEPIGPVTPTVTEFEQVVREYKLSPDQYLRSTRLREWARRNKNSKYIPEPLLEAWGFEIESTL